MFVIQSPLPSLCHLVRVPAGPFLMGSVNGDIFERPVHEVITSDYLIGQTAVSNYHFKAYRDHIQAMPFGLFGTNAQTGLFEMIRRYEASEVEESESGSIVLDMEDYAVRPGRERGYRNLEVQRVILEEGEALAIYGKYQDQFGGDDQPAVFVTWYMALSCADWMVQEMVKAGMLAQGVRWKGRLPTEAEWEKAARGPRVDLGQVMREEKVNPDQFVDWAKDRYENFLVSGKTLPLEEVQRRLMNPRSLLRRQLGKEESMILSGYRVYSTPSGRHSDDEFCWNQEWSTGRPHNVNWGPKTGYGTQQMSGNVWEWVGDWLGSYDPKLNLTNRWSGEERLLRGGSWVNEREELRMANRSFYVPAYNYCDSIIGFRIAAASQSVDSRENA